jgi:hypothetical protein
MTLKLDAIVRGWGEGTVDLRHYGRIAHPSYQL